MDPYTTPAFPPPPGEVSNFHAGTTEVQHRLIIVYAGTLAAATFTLGLRIWTRAGLLRELWWDDYVVIAAWLMDIGFYVCIIQWMQYGFGDHLWNVNLIQIEQFAKFSTPVVATYCWAPMLTKLSILMLYLRLNPGRIFRILVFFLMFLGFAYTLATTIIVAAGCKPSDPTKVKCINNLALAQAILNIASDVFIIILPLPMIYKLQMPNGQKIALTVLLSAGSFVVVASLIRLVLVQELLGKTDTTWAEAELCVWSAIEVNVGLMCNCLVVTKPLIQRYAGGLLSFKSSHNGSYPNSDSLGGGGTGTRTKRMMPWRKEADSVPLTSIDTPERRRSSVGGGGAGGDEEMGRERGVRAELEGGAGMGVGMGKSGVRPGGDNILVTTTYTVGDEQVAMHANGADNYQQRQRVNTVTGAPSSRESSSTEGLSGRGAEHSSRIVGKTGSGGNSGGSGGGGYAGAELRSESQEELAGRVRRFR